MRKYVKPDDIHPLGELVDELVKDFGKEPDPKKLNPQEEDKGESADR